MGYEAALEKAWEDLAKLKPGKNLSVKFLADEYDIDTQARKVISLSCNIPAKDFAAILILHYLARKLSGLPELSNDWLDFKELSAIEGYQAAFRKRVIERIIRKYGSHPEGVLSVLEKVPGKRIKEADVGIVLEVFENVPALIQLWRPDEEFGPEANLLFDRSITGIFCTEDIVVLAEFIAASL
jgi:hypothetical protein